MRLAIANLKGGVGKSTTSLFLAEYFAAIKRHRVLVIDLDPQSNLSFMLLSSTGVKIAESAHKTLPHFIQQILKNEPTNVDDFVQVGGSDLIELKQSADHACIHVLPSVPGMWFVEAELNKQFYIKNEDPAHQLHASMKRCLDDLNNQYDIVIIDCPPGFSTLSQTGLLLADAIISPTIADEVSARSLKDFVDVGLKDILGMNAKDRHHVVISKYMSTQPERRVLDVLKRDYDVFAHVIRQSVDMVRASYYLDPSTAGRPFNRKYGAVAEDVRVLSDEIYRLIFKAR